MVSESDLLSIISRQYSNGVYLDDPNVIRYLSGAAGEEISGITLSRVKEKMFTNSSGCSFTLDSIADEEVIEEITSTVCDFIEHFHRYQSVAFFDHYRYKINEAIIHDADSFQELLKFILPRGLYNFEMKRLKQGPLVTEIVTALEELVEENGDSIGLDELAVLVPGFTRDTIVKCFDKYSTSYRVVNDERYQYVEPIPDVPDDMFQVAEDVADRLLSMGLFINDEIMNAVLSEKFGYDVSKDYGVFSDWKRRSKGNE